MSDIGKFAGGGGHWSGTPGAQSGFDPHRRETTARRQSKTGEVGGIASASGLEEAAEPDKVAAFELRLRMASKNLADDRPRDEADPFADARLLAVAETLPSPTGLPSFSDLAAPTAAPSTPTAAAMVATVTRHIEDAIRADMRPAKGEPLKLRLDFADGLAGLKGMTMSVTPTTLDVVLERSAGDMSPDLLAATAILADRLRLRFGKRIVRILDRVDAPASAHAPSLSDLFTENEG